MRYINIPFTSRKIHYEHLSKFIKIIENTDHPILIHCTSGNRAGALWIT
ncbi:MAG: hypothetical protein CMH70_09310 [Nitrosomonadaceae bacterium]|nr:hypothetical protein [Nitrosomonadaceae bacterium]